MDEIQQKSEILSLMIKNSDSVSIPKEIAKARDSFMKTQSFSPELGTKAYYSARYILTLISTAESSVARGKLASSLTKVMDIWFKAMSQPNQRYCSDYLSQLQRICDTAGRERGETVTVKERVLSCLDQTIKDLKFLKEVRHDEDNESNFTNTIAGLESAYQEITATVVPNSVTANDFAKSILSATADLRRNIADGLTANREDVSLIQGTAQTWHALSDVTERRVKPKDAVPGTIYSDELSQIKIFEEKTGPMVTDFFRTADKIGDGFSNKLDQLYAKKEALIAECSEILTKYKNGDIDKRQATYRSNDAKTELEKIDANLNMLHNLKSGLIDSVNTYINKIHGYWDQCLLAANKTIMNEIFGNIDYHEIISNLRITGSDPETTTRKLMKTLSTLKGVDEQIERQMELWQTSSDYIREQDRKAQALRDHRAQRNAAISSKNQTRTDESSLDASIDWLENLVGDKHKETNEPEEEENLDPQKKKNPADKGD